MAAKKKAASKKAASKRSSHFGAVAASLAQAKAMLAVAKKRSCSNERGDYAAFAVDAAIFAKAPSTQKNKVIRDALKLARECGAVPGRRSSSVMPARGLKRLESRSR